MHDKLIFHAETFYHKIDNLLHLVAGRLSKAA